MASPESSALRPVVAALVRAVLSIDDRVAREQRPVLEATTDGLLRKIYGMPRYLGLGMMMLVVLFDWYGLFFGLRRFRALSLDRATRQLEHWRRLPVGPCRQFVEFYEKMGTFIYYSQLEARSPRLAATGTGE